MSSVKFVVLDDTKEEKGNGSFSRRRLIPPILVLCLILVTCLLHIYCYKHASEGDTETPESGDSGGNAAKFAASKHDGGMIQPVPMLPSDTTILSSSQQSTTPEDVREKPTTTTTTTTTAATPPPTTTTTTPVPTTAAIKDNGDFFSLGKFFISRHPAPDHIYKVFDKCQQIGGVLAQIADQEELDLVTRLMYDSGLKFDGYFIDGHDMIHDNYWISWYTNQNITFLPWADNEPNEAGSGEDCLQLQMKREKPYNDHRCDGFHSNNAFICEVNPTNNVPKTPRMFPETTTSPVHQTTTTRQKTSTVHAPIEDIKDEGEYFSLGDFFISKHPAPSDIGQIMRKCERLGRLLPGIGGFLAQIADQEELDLVIRLMYDSGLKFEGYMIDGHLSRFTWKKRWVSWHTQQPITFLPWDDGQPNNADKWEGCLQLKRKREKPYNDYVCDVIGRNISFLCKVIRPPWTP